MNLVDVILIVLVLLSLVRGLRLGAAVQVLSFGGFWIGLLAGAAIAPSVARLVSGPVAKAILSLVVVFGAASVVGGLGRHLGVRVWRVIRRVHLGPADSGVGAVVAVVASLLAAWIVASMLATAPVSRVSSAINGSSILRGIDAILPPAPTVFSRIQKLLDTHGFPQVFAQLAPQSVGAAPLPTDPTLRAAVQSASASTVKVVAEGCGELLEGSGFVVGRDTVVTNAHVIAGTHSITVLDQGGRHFAVPIYFDPNFDLAVLRAGPLFGPPLNILDSTVSNGTQGAVLGYPGGGPFDAEPAAVDQEFEALGRDIYGSGLTRRSVYEVHANIRAGNSGGPLVEPNGTVVGVVFSRSASQPDIGYALTTPPVVSRIQSAERTDTPTGTGSCAE
ncbi:MAG TPA: MarP family serine protease [Acidimicrobiales bacterium]|nr:MarP family serine protease [Acidimicrobiales bacterium]